MAKRLTREEKDQQTVIDLINEMFRIAEHDVTFDDIKDRKDDWFTQWTMTVAQHDVWFEWGVAYLKKKYRYRTEYAKRQMGMIALMWGLKFSNSPYDTAD